MTVNSSIFIVGCGRNGTSMTAGLFRESGYYMGDRLHPPADENPTGYFEDAAINKLNNAIISRCLPPRVSYEGVDYACDSPIGKCWLARLPLSQEFSVLADEDEAIRRFTGATPFCLKDTRFCYLLPFWRRHAPAAKMICVFRRPEVAALSILNCCRNRTDLSNIAISVNQAFEIWTLCYLHILRRHSVTGDWLFLRYEDVLSGDALDAIETFAGVGVDRSFPRSSLNRTEARLSPPDSAVKVYDELLSRTAKQ